MIDLNQPASYFPAEIAENKIYSKYILKEYVQLMILDFLSTSAYVKNIVFIGGTNLKVVKGIDRFSEDLDFDCKDLTEIKFKAMTDDVLQYLRRAGFRVERRDKQNTRLTAFRCNILFPELLFELGLSGHREERFLIKIEAQDQGINYDPAFVNIKQMGFFFPFPVPPDNVLCAMKVSALLSRAKGRDFYDVMFLLGRTEPDYNFLSLTCGIGNKKELKESLLGAVDKTDVRKKSRDFAHLLLDERSAGKILRFREFAQSL